MKLRIKGNSIRFRLLRSEVERFATDGVISDETNFGDGKLRYSLVVSDDVSPRATIEDNELSVFVPTSVGNQRAATEEVGIEAQQRIGDGETLSILIEKDFECIGRPDDPDRADAFPAR